VRLVIALIPAIVLIAAFQWWEVIEARKRLRWWAEGSGRIVRSARWRPLRLIQTRAISFDAELEEHGSVMNARVYVGNDWWGLFSRNIWVEADGQRLDPPVTPS
jgi:hypothetical protein